MNKHQKTDFFSFISSVNALNNDLIDKLINYLHKNFTEFQLRILVAIDDNEGISVSELSKLLKMNYGNTSTQCRLLEERRMIKRMRNKDDERKVELHLDKKGTEVINSINYFKTTFMRTLAKNYTKKDWDDMTQSVNNVSLLIDQAVAVLHPKED